MNLNRKQLRIIIRRLNLPRTICDHVIGEAHSTSHRMVAGGVVMLVSVSIVHWAGTITFAHINVIVDIIGYFFHGLGSIPFVQFLQGEEEETKESKPAPRAQKEEEPVS